MEPNAAFAPAIKPSASGGGTPAANPVRRLMEFRIGIIPLPVYVLLLALFGTFATMEKILGEITIMIAILVAGGFTCAEIGRQVPIVNRIGGSSLVTIFLPSFLVTYQLLPAPMVQGVTTFTKSTDFIYLFIAAVVVGSILSMDSKVLIQGFIKIVIPIALGSAAALLAGGIVGSASPLWRPAASL